MKRSKKTALIGQDLKQIREQRGWSLQQASQVTRIRADLLELIEQDRLEKFHNPNFLHALVRIYSLALGLNPEIFLERLQQNTDKKSHYSEQYPPQYEPEHNTKEPEPVVGFDDRAQEWGSKIVGALVSLVVIAIVAVVYQSVQKSNPAILNNLSKESATSNSTTLEETPLPLIPRERLQSQNRPSPKIENPVVSPTAALAYKSQPSTTNSQIETPVSDYPTSQSLTIVRPRKVLNIPQVEDNTIAQNTDSSTPNQYHDTENTLQEEELEPVILTADLPIRAAIPVNPSHDTTYSSFQQNTSNPNSASDAQQIIQQPRQTEESVVLDEEPLEEEVTLTDQQFQQLLERSSNTLSPSQHSSRSTNDSLFSNGQSVASIPRAVPAQPILINPPPTDSYPVPADIQELNNDSQNEIHPAIPIHIPNQIDTRTQPTSKTSASLFTPSIDALSDALNQLRLELSKEAYVRVFVNDISGEPSLDEVLPAGSAASWEGHTFYVTIRPANAATFYYNGQRYDYTNSGPENVTLRFP